MTRRRRRVLGPLFYSTLVLAVIATAYTWVVTVSGDHMRRAAARREITYFANMLRDANPDARETAARILLTRGHDVALPYLREAARDPHREIRALACRALIQAYADPTVVVPVLNAAAGDDQDVVRLEAARGLGRVHVYAALVGRSDWAGGDPAAHSRANSLETLSRLLKDPASEVRAAAAEALGEFAPDPTAATGLAAATGDQDRAVRFAAARELLRFDGIGNLSAIRTLLALLADPEPVPDR